MYTYTKLQLFQELLLNGTLEAGSLQWHQLLKSWQAFTFNAFNTCTLIDIFKLSHKTSLFQTPQL